MHESDDEQRARLAYEASLRALDQQRRSLEEIRSRTGVLLAAASISASFLGSRAFEHHASAIVTGLALGALVLTLLFGIRVLTFRDDLLFVLSGTTLDAGLFAADDRADQHRRLAAWLDLIWAQNKATMRRLDVGFRFAAAALATQIVLWTVAIGASFGGS